MSSQCQSKSTTLKILPDEKKPNQTKSTEKNNKQTKPQPNEQKTKTKKKKQDSKTILVPELILYECFDVLLQDWK